MLDPVSTFLWYSVVIFGLCGVVAGVAAIIDRRIERRARWLAREQLRRARPEMFSLTLGSGSPQEGERQSGA